MGKIELYKCEDILDVRDGTHESPKYISNGYPLITSKNIKEGKIVFENVNYISDEDFEAINRRSKVDIGDILMPMIGTIGNPVIVNKNADFAIKNVALFKFNNNDKVNNRYFYYFLKSDLFDKQLIKIKRGGTQNFISLKNIRNLEVPLPDIDTQYKIVGDLDKAYSLIEKRKVQINALDQLTQSVFLEMFGDPVKNIKGWKTGSLGELSDVIGGYAFKSSELKQDHGIPLIKIGTVNKGYFDISNFSFVPEVTERYKKYLVYPGDLLISLTGTVGKEDYGNVSVATNDYQFYLLNQRVAKIVPQKDLEILYLYYCFKQPKFKSLLTKLSRGIRQANISNEDIKNLQVPIPPDNIQKDFLFIVNKNNKIKINLKKSLELLEHNYNSIMQLAFKGEVFIQEKLPNA